MIPNPVYRSPDAIVAGTGSDLLPSKKKIPAKRFLPESQVGIAALGTAVALNYAAGATATPAVGLIWTTPANFTAMTAALAAKVGQASTSKADRTPNAALIDQIDTEINKRLGNVRTYLDQQYEDEDSAVVRGYLAALGFKVQHGSYVFPRGQQERLDALGTLLNGLTKHGLNGRKYGLTYWTTLQSRYQTALKQASSAAGAVSTVVDEKNELLDQVTEVLRAIYFLLRAQYPKNWKVKLRAYGYQEEGYA